MLSNNNTLRNIVLNPGPLTEADHIPIIMSITAKAITKHIPPILDLRKAQWEQFKEEISNNIPATNTHEHMTKEDIDNKLQL